MVISRQMLGLRARMKVPAASMHTNRLAHEKSPYLLQHAHNPVDWYPWGEEAFEKARSEDKPVFLSIGYSTCHWCHVMERESFESEEVAQVLNHHFVPVKVDREERPDVDRIYMLYVQATSGGGGWPMSVFLTPELKPFFGGTYFPPDSRYGRPGFRDILERLAQAWRSDRARVLQASRDVIDQLRQYSAAPPAAALLEPGMLDSGFYQFRRGYDSRNGGFGGAPKFPRPVVHNFLLRYFYRTKNQEASEMVLRTLDAMARGGMHDHLGGGFHRYAVDDRWFVPHFEKMLYDQAQLAVSYLEGYQVSGDQGLARVARGIFEYVLRDMTNKDGGFYSAEDADSPDPANPSVKGEGAFYIWTAGDIERILGKPAGEWFCHRFGVVDGGNVPEAQDPHHEFTGRSILFAAHTVEETAARFGIAAERIAAALEDARGKLLEERSRRPRPHLDDKILTAWNGLMISALAQGSQILGEPRYLEAARRAADFVLGRMYEGATLLRRYRDGEAAIAGFLDDYAFFAHGLLDLYEAGFALEDLRAAIELTDRMIEGFEDHEHGGFFATAEGDASLVMRMKDDYDGAEPSGNSIAALNLLRLHHITGDQRYRDSAERALRAFAQRMDQLPSGMPQLLVALLSWLEPPRQVILAGDKDAAETREFLRIFWSRFLPLHEILLADGGEARATLAAWMHSLPAAQPGKTVACVCENLSCRLPTSDPAQFAQLLE